MVRERGSVGKEIVENKIRERITKKSLGNRKEGLKKKLNELTTLCGTQAFMICLESSPSEVANGTDHDQPVVAVDVWPEQPKEHQPIIQKYLQTTMRKEDGEKHHSTTVSSSLTTLNNNNNNIIMEQQQQQNNNNNNRKLLVQENGRTDELDGLGMEELIELKRVLDNKLEEVKKRANLLKAAETISVPGPEVIVEVEEEYRQEVVLPGINGNDGDERGGMVSCGWGSSSTGTTGFRTLENINVASMTRNVGFNHEQDAYNCYAIGAAETVSVPAPEVVVAVEEEYCQQEVVLPGTNGIDGDERGGTVSCGWGSSSAGTTGFGTLENINVASTTGNVGFNHEQDAYYYSANAAAGNYFLEDHHQLMTLDPMMGWEMGHHLHHYDQVQEYLQAPPLVNAFSQNFWDFNHLTALGGLF